MSALKVLGFLVISISSLVSETASACKCTATALQRLWDAPADASIATLLKVPVSPAAELAAKEPKPFVPYESRLELMPYKAGAPKVWKHSGISCDLRWQEDVWYVLISTMTGDSQPMMCNSIYQPVSEAAELLAQLEKAWDKNAIQPNPHWSVGCKVDSDCVLDESRGCLPSAAIRPKYQTAIKKWRQAQEPRLNCERAPAKPGTASRPSGESRSKRVRCHTGVCELLAR